VNLCKCLTDLLQCDTGSVTVTAWQALNAEATITDKATEACARYYEHTSNTWEPKPHCIVQPHSSLIIVCHPVHTVYKLYWQHACSLHACSLHARLIYAHQTKRCRIVLSQNTQLLIGSLQYTVPVELGYPAAGADESNCTKRPMNQGPASQK
jgi:hypothetical protein